MSTMRTSWREVFPPEEREIYQRAGFGVHQVTAAHPALLVIDVTYGFTGQRNMSDADAVAAYPNACVPAAWPAVDATVRLVAAARAAARPVLISRDTSGDAGARSVWHGKHGRLAGRRTDDATIVAELSPSATELIEKSVPSLFFGNDLADRLRVLGIDSVVVAGTSTSGCVRATVVDAFSHGFAVTVVEDCVFDRSPTSHAVSLFEIDQKYGNVVTLDDALAAFPGASQAASG
jgi:maleamate amidohydrolase